MTPVAQYLSGGGEIVESSSDSLPAFGFPMSGGIGSVYYEGEWISPTISVVAVPEPVGLQSATLLGLSACWLATARKSASPS